MKKIGKIIIVSNNIYKNLFKVKKILTKTNLLFYPLMTMLTDILPSTLFLSPLNLL